MKKKLNTN